jgi:hypothetical protein
MSHVQSHTPHRVNQIVSLHARLGRKFTEKIQCSRLQSRRDRELGPSSVNGGGGSELVAMQRERGHGKGRRGGNVRARSSGRLL